MMGVPEELELSAAGGFAITDAVDESSESPVALLETRPRSSALPRATKARYYPQSRGGGEKITDTNIIQISGYCNQESGSQSKQRLRDDQLQRSLRAGRSAAGGFAITDAVDELGIAGRNLPLCHGQRRRGGVVLGVRAAGRNNLR